VAEGPWYRDGLRFTCTQCGNCCSGDPGYVWLSGKEAKRIAACLGIEPDAFKKQHVRRVGLRYSLKELPNGDCTLLKRDGDRAYCTAYEQRPAQCRTFPFWNDVLRSRRSWDEAARKCPGMNQGEHHNFVAIEQIRVCRS
jgi:Fe-S-cluster containining protein